jgi:four helix bundle protein
MRVAHYEDLDASKLATELRRTVIKLTARPTVRGDRRFCDQIRSSAASITANIAEGFGRYTDPDFLRFLRYARGSAFETREWLRDGLDREHFAQAGFDDAWMLLERATGAVTRLAQEIVCEFDARRPHAVKRGSGGPTLITLPPDHPVPRPP